MTKTDYYWRICVISEIEQISKAFEYAVRSYASNESVCFVLYIIIIGDSSVAYETDYRSEGKGSSPATVLWLRG